MIIDPYTGRSFDHDSALECLKQWTSNRRVQQAMLKSEMADMDGLINLVSMVRLAMENDRGGLDENQATDVLLQMVESKPVRKAITRLIAENYGITLWQAARDLKVMYVELATRIGALETAH